MTTWNPEDAAPEPTEELERLIAQGRGEFVEILPAGAPPRKLAECLAAFANAKGGAVVVQIPAAPDGEAQVEAARDAIREAALLCDPPLILPVPRAATTADGPALVVHVPGGLPRAYAVQGKFYARAGARNQVLGPREVRRLMLERGEVGFESQVPPAARLEDLDQAKVARYLAALQGLVADTPEQTLLLRGCLAERDGALVPTYAGILLFGKHPERFCRNSEIIAVRYLGDAMDDEFVREDIRDTLPEQIRRAEAFLVSHMRRGVRINGLARDEETEYPLKAVREAIVNAVAHRDYTIRGDSIRIAMFSNRIEFYSPGRLPGHVTLQNIVSERFSRNEVIVQVLSDLGFIERLGYGIDRMIRLMLERGLPAPEFEETANGFKVTLRGPAGRFVATRPDARRWPLLHLNPRQHQALEYIAQNGRITNREFQELAPDVSPETIRRDLADLVDKGLLLKIGEKRATYYILK
ncbi:MAG: DeoR family transcriptional regulator [Chloroflexi bacterium]|nr:DeoR family transcriptional regulator [Chloroflexota bacterium]